MDVIIPFKSDGITPFQDSEIKYAIRSLATNMIDLGDIIIVGRCPLNIKPGTHYGHTLHVIIMDDPVKHFKDINMVNKVKAGIRLSQSKTVVWQCDDSIWLKPVKGQDIPTYHGGSISSIYKIAPKSNSWGGCLVRSSQYLLSKGYPDFNYEGHYPVPIDSQSFLDMQWPLGTTISTIYFNQVVAKTDHLKQPAGYKLTSEGLAHREHLKQQLASHQSQFLGFNDLGINTGRLNLLLPALFPTQSPWES